MEKTVISNKEDRCVNCKVIIRKVCGKLKRIVTDEDLNRYQAHCENTVQIGSIFCHKCRLIIYRNTQPTASTSNNDNAEDNNHDSDLDDPDFKVFCRNASRKEYVELQIKRVKVTHIYCTLCQSNKNLTVVPLDARLQAFTKRRIFIPKGNKCCTSHLIKKRFFNDELQLLRVYSNYSLIEKEEVSEFLNLLAVNVDSVLLNRIGEFSVSEEEIFTYTGLKWENIIQLQEMLTSMRNSEGRSVIQALVVFLFKLKTGNSNEIIQRIFGLTYHQQVSDYFHQVIEAFEKDILPFYFGIHAKTREDLITNETSYVARSLLDFRDSTLGLIFDGTYLRHEKSKNNIYQRKSYSGQNKAPLCKPFTICTTNGYIVDIAGPFNGTMNDASIMKNLLEEQNGLKSLLQQGDFCIFDRGFRDVVDYIKGQGYHVFMPACKGNRAQLTTEEANASRFVTKVRWVVEAVHGSIGQKYHLLHNVLDNKLLPVAKSLCKIAGFLNNAFGKRLNSDIELADSIIVYMKERQTQQNTMQELVENQNLNRHKKPFTTLSSTSLMDFPELTENDLKILFTGTYQLSQAICYLAEIMTDEGLNLEYLKDSENIIRVRVRSRHINRKTYNCYIEYEPNLNSYKGIQRYVCDCANGNRTVGCCAHIAAVIYYLSHGRYKSKILKPAEILTSIFDKTSVTTTIEEDSDDD